MNIARHVERAAKFFPDKAAIIFEGVSWSYRTLNEQANRLANALKANGIMRGERVALYLPNIPQFAVCYLAILKIGAIAVSVNAILKAEEVAYILDDSGAKLVFTTGELLRHIPSRDEALSPLQVVVCEGDAQGRAALDDWLSKGASEGKALEMERDASAALLYTSGTTGFPKGATLTHGNVVWNSWTTMHHTGYRLDDRLMLYLPLFHCFGQNHIMNGAFQACATLVLHRRFAPDVILDAMQRERVTMFFGVPSVYIQLLNSDLSPWDLSALRYEFSAAAALPTEIWSHWKERFGREIYEGYGLTESSPFVCYNHDFRHKFGSVGTAMENVEVQICDPQGHVVPEGQWGEICVRSPGVMAGYWNKPEANAQTLRDGWLHTGDIGLMDDEEYVFIVDRVKDMINVSGFKVWPAEVEQLLYRHPAIKEVAVYGVSDPLKGEQVRAAVVLKAGAVATRDEVIAFCRERMAVYKAPQEVTFLAELPKSATGKILKRVLRE